jgi:hypothetical protein
VKEGKTMNTRKELHPSLQENKWGSKIVGLIILLVLIGLAVSGQREEGKKQEQEQSTKKQEADLTKLRKDQNWKQIRYGNMHAVLQEDVFAVADPEEYYPLNRTRMGQPYIYSAGDGAPSEIEKGMAHASYLQACNDKRVRYIWKGSEIVVEGEGKHSILKITVIRMAKHSRDEGYYYVHAENLKKSVDLDNVMQIPKAVVKAQPKPIKMVTITVKTLGVKDKEDFPVMARFALTKNYQGLDKMTDEGKSVIIKENTPAELWERGLYIEDCVRVKIVGTDQMCWVPKESITE